MSRRPGGPLFFALLALAVFAAGCGSASDDLAAKRASSTKAEVLSETFLPLAAPPAPAPPPVSPAVAAAIAPTTTAPKLRGPRIVHEQPWVPFAMVGEVVLHHPSARVEMVGFHESSHDGAREYLPLPSAVAPVTLESRERGTGARTAADIVVEPGVEIRSPVTGRVKRSGSYVLYCDHRDHYAVIEPDAHPGWEVKLLHMSGMAVRAGDRVEAGVTVIAPGPTQLPFESQVDEVSAQPAWPHVHVEVVDPTIPDRPGKGCS